MTIEEKYIAHVEECFAKADRNESKINDEIIALDGMTGTKTRHLYNNLLSMPDAKYFEIGIWKGSSSCAAMFGNKATVTLCDDFSGFGGPREEFENNFEKYKGENDAMVVIGDCFNPDTKNVFYPRTFNIYLGDGDHSFSSQRKFVTDYVDVMDNVFIMITDDWNWSDVRMGTMAGIQECNLEILWQKEIRLTNDDQFTHDQQLAKDTWWNGIGVFIIKKPK